jgi:hypothetical protein
MKTMRRFFTPAKKSVCDQGNNHNVPARSLSLAFLFTVAITTSAWAQLGIYEFTGTGACPNQNPNVTTQPANSIFSSFSAVNATCVSQADIFSFRNWNSGGTIDLTEYYEFSISANSGYGLNLSNLSFIHRVSENGSGSGTGLTRWTLRSNLDNYTSNIASGLTNDTKQNASISLPAGFNNIGSARFRFYITLIKDNTTSFELDDVAVGGTEIVLPANPADPTSNSPQCSNPGVTLTATGSAPAGETWYWQTSASGTSTANSGSTYVVNTSGTYISGPRTTPHCSGVAVQGVLL